MSQNCKKAHREEPSGINFWSSQFPRQNMLRKKDESRCFSRPPHRGNYTASFVEQCTVNIEITAGQISSVHICASTQI